MPQAVRFDHYGGIDVLNVVEVPQPVPEQGQVLVAVRAAGINPGEARIREGALHSIFPATFPSGEGSDLAGVVGELGPGVELFAVGDEVLGFTNARASQADFVLVDVENLVPKPAEVSWEVAGSLFVAGTTAYAAVRAVSLKPGETVVVAGAAGGVGCIAVQLAGAAGATVIGLASEPNHVWLTDHGVIPVAYGDGVADRIKAVAGKGVDAFIDTYGGGYVELALFELGVAQQRIDTIANFDAAARFGVKNEGTAAAANATVLAELVDMIARGKLEVPIAAVYPLEQVRDAYKELERRHTRGKIVLVP